MKIAVCGKGGCGKSTVTILLAKELAKKGKKVLIIDSDESNYGLSRQLGVSLPQDFTAYFGGKAQALQNMMLSNFTHQFFHDTWTLSDVPQEFSAEKNGVRLMVSGKIHSSNEGCACAMGTIISQFIDHLVLAENEFALMDMEAGIEHFGRGIDNGVDLILMIVDPSYESLTMSRKIRELAESIQKPIFFVLNKVTEENISLMEETICEGAQIICRLPATNAIMAAGLKGEEILGEYEEIKNMAAFLGSPLQQLNKGTTEV